MKKILLFIAAAMVAASVSAYDTHSITPKGNISNYTKTNYTIVSKFGSTYRSVAVKYVHLYNNIGLETECTGYNAKDVMVDKVTYDYDAKYHLTSSTFYNAQNAIIWKTTNEYDTTGRITVENEYDG